MRAALLALLLVACDEGRDQAAGARPAARPSAELAEIEVELLTEVEEGPDWGLMTGSFSTRFSVDGEGKERAKNIRKAASALDSAVVPAGGRISFNSVVGERTAERGFVPAPALFLGERTVEVGGGVCQVSSTMHAAALDSRMRIVRRAPHSRPSQYIRAGLDATVTSGCVADAGCQDLDLVVENPHGIPVGIRASVRESGREAEVTVSFHGRGRDWETSFRGWSAKGDDPEKRVRRTGKLRGSGKRRIQEGAAGRNVFMTVTWSFRDGGSESLRVLSSYPPVHEVWEVGPGYEGSSPWEAEAVPSGSNEDR